MEIINTKSKENKFLKLNKNRSTTNQNFSLVFIIILAYYMVMPFALKMRIYDTSKVIHL